MGVSDHADYGPSHRSTFSVFISGKIICVRLDSDPIMPLGPRRINIL
jgi:hypothetical protein